MQLQPDFLPPEPTTEAPPTHFPSDQPLPSLSQEPSKSTPGENNPGSAFAVDPLAELGSGVKSLTPTADLNISSATTGSNDPFASFGSFPTVSKSGGAISTSDSAPLPAPNSADPLSSLGALGGGSSGFASDPFPGLSSVSFPAQTSVAASKTETSISDTASTGKPIETGISETATGKPIETLTDISHPADSGSSVLNEDPFANLNSDSSQFGTDWGVSTSSSKPSPPSESLNKSDTGDKAAKPDPYAAFSGLADENPFPSDPFAGSDALGNDGTSGDNAVTSSGNMFGNTLNTQVQPNDSKADPYAAFAELGVSSDTSAPGTNFPAPPADMLAAVEKDALQSDLPGLGNIAETSKPASSNADFSIQTSTIDPFQGLGTTLSGQAQTTVAAETDLFSSLNPSTESTPPPLPTKQGPQRPAPLPSLKRSESKTEDSPAGDKDVRFCKIIAHIIYR